MKKRYLLGLAVSIAALWVFFAKIPLAEMTGLLRQMDTRLLLPSILAYCLSYVARTLRWQVLLSPLGQTPFGQTLSALVVGFMGNNLLPAHLGEFIRAYMLKKERGYAMSGTMATIVLERVFDGLTALLLLVIALMFMPMPQTVSDSFITVETLRGAGWVGGLLFGGLLVMLQLFRSRTQWSLRILKRLLAPLPPRLSETLLAMVGTFSQGLNCVSIPKLISVTAFSIITWALICLHTWFVFPAFGLDLDFYAAMLVQVILVLAMLIPASPGAIGTYHLAAASMLIFLGAQGGLAGSIAMVLWLIHFIVTNAAGLFFLWKSGVRLATVSSTAKDGGATEPETAA